MKRSPLTALWLAGALVLLGATMLACQSRGTDDVAPDVAADEEVLDQEYGAEPEAATPEQTLAEREEQIAERERQLAQAEKSVARRESQVRKQESSRPATPTSGAPPTSQPAAPAYQVVTVSLPTTTAIDVEFVDTLSSETNVTGDTFRTRVLSDVVHEGIVAIPAGSAVYGRVSEAVDSKKIGGQAKLALEFDRLELPSGEEFPIRASFAEAAKSQTKKDAATIGGATAGGALLGRVLGKKDKGKYTVLGAAVGAAVGTAIAAKNPGEPVIVEPGTVVALALDETVQVAVRKPADYRSVAKTD